MADLLDDPMASTLDAGDWEWDIILDFSLGSFPSHILPWQSEELLDERLLASQDLEVQQAREVQNASPENQSQDADEHEKVVASRRIHKWDPRLTCSNFLAGRVPCACPEMDRVNGVYFPVARIEIEGFLGLRYVCSRGFALLLQVKAFFSHTTSERLNFDQGFRFMF